MYLLYIGYIWERHHDNHNVAEIINQVAYGHSSVILTRRGEEIAALVSMEELQLLRQIEDVMDIAEAQKALAEPRDNLPAAEFWQKLGL